MASGGGTSARTLARRAALQALYQWQLTGQTPDDIEAQFLSEREIGRADKTFFRELLDAIPANVDELDQRLLPLLDRPLEQLDPVERAILRIGAFELVHRPETPWRVVINEAVELAKRFGAEQSHKYVNGILDKVAIKVRAEAVSGDSA